MNLALKLGLILFLTISGCHDSSPSAQLNDDENPSAGSFAQMNDVSTLFPMPRTASEYAQLLAASDAGLGGVLLPKSLIGCRRFQRRQLIEPEAE